MLWRGAGRIVTAAGRELMPALCPLCRAVPRPAGATLCGACRDALAALPAQRCTLCGGGQDGVLEVCSECLRFGERPWGHAVSAFPFRGAVREAVHRLKYQGGTAVVPFLGSAMAENWRQYGCSGPAVIVAVPLYWTRQWGRGYNQAELLARYVGAELGLPCERLLRRRRRTAQQAMLDMDARRRNVRGVFAAARRARTAGRRVLLVDDVMTTGATLGEAARTLGDAGVAAVSVLTAARG